MTEKTKIASILPYKENYTTSKAQAAALWVSDFYKFSKFKKNNFFENTDKKDYLTKNYINIPLKLKSKFYSTTNEYCDEFLKINKKKFDIIVTIVLWFLNTV